MLCLYNGGASMESLWTEVARPKALRARNFDQNPNQVCLQIMKKVISITCNMLYSLYF